MTLQARRWTCCPSGASRRSIGATSTTPRRTTARRPRSFCASCKCGLEATGLGKDGTRGSLQPRCATAHQVRTACRYAFWAGAPDFAYDMLDPIAECAQDGGAMPRAFKASVCDPHDPEILEDEVAVPCSAATIRPITLTCRPVASPQRSGRTST